MKQTLLFLFAFLLCHSSPVLGQNYDFRFKNGMRILAGTDTPVQAEQQDRQVSVQRLLVQH